MRNQIAALVLMLVIVVSGIMVVQAQLKIGKPMQLQSNIKTYTFQQINNGAKQLSDAVNELNKIPAQVGEMYTKLSQARPEVQQGIISVDEAIQALAKVAEDVKNNTMIVSSIKTPLLESLDVLAETLPSVATVLKKLDDAFQDTANERVIKIEQIESKIATAINNINGEDILGRNLPQRMNALADFLSSLGI